MCEVCRIQNKIVIGNAVFLENVLSVTTTNFAMQLKVKLKQSVNTPDKKRKNIKSKDFNILDCHENKYL